MSEKPATDELRGLLADMHDSADDESCYHDDGDGSCFACRCFVALVAIEDAHDARIRQEQADAEPLREALRDIARACDEFLGGLSDHDQHSDAAILAALVRQVARGALDREPDE